MTQADKILAGQTLKIPPTAVVPTTMPTATTGPPSATTRAPTATTSGAPTTTKG